MGLDKEAMRYAQWVADLMAADGVKPEQLTQELIMAYMDTIGRKIAAIQSTFLTRVGAKEALLNTIYTEVIAS